MFVASLALTGYALALSRACRLGMRSVFACKPERKPGAA